MFPHTVSFLSKQVDVNHSTSNEGTRVLDLNGVLRGGERRIWFYLETV